MYVYSSSGVQILNLLHFLLETMLSDLGLIIIMIVCYADESADRRNSTIAEKPTNQPTKGKAADRYIT